MLLLVDDEADVRFMLSLYLEDEGIEFTEARSGAEALERTAGEAFDLVLLDQRMPPGPDGIDVAEALRARGAAMPIVLYSAYLDPSVAQRAADLGITTVEKGEPDKLVATVRTALV
jgi:two-component system, OmpR family, response regulator